MLQGRMELKKDGWMTALKNAMVTILVIYPPLFPIHLPSGCGNEGFVEYLPRSVQFYSDIDSYGIIPDGLAPNLISLILCSILLLPFILSFLFLRCRSSRCMITTSTNLILQIFLKANFMRTLEGTDEFHSIPSSPST